VISCCGTITVDLGSWAACRPVVLRGDESARTEGVWLLESSISAQTVHFNLSIFSSRTSLHV
jgi:hypothetical protein